MTTNIQKMSGISSNMKNIVDSHDQFVQSGRLLLINISENFRDACLKTYKLDPANFYSAPGLAWIAVQLELLTNID